jgi:hypothetical protein
VSISVTSAQSNFAAGSSAVVTGDLVVTLDTVEPNTAVIPALSDEAVFPVYDAAAVEAAGRGDQRCASGTKSSAPRAPRRPTVPPPAAQAPGRSLSIAIARLPSWSTESYPFDTCTAVVVSYAPLIVAIKYVDTARIRPSSGDVP